jgi:hypothetical protein
MRKSLLLVLFGAASAMFAQSPTRTYAGGYSTNWKTRGAHGHDQPCNYLHTGGHLPDGTPVLVDDCDADDFARGNLDNSIGFRFGRERDLLAWRALRVTGGYDTSVSDTEYNISQRDLGIFAGAGVAGIDVTRWGARIGVRYGLGAFLTTDVRYGAHSFTEVAATIPLANGSAIRITRRTAVDGHAAQGQVRLAGFSSSGDSAEATEFGVLFIAGPVREYGSHWDFAATSGMSAPGKLYGDGLNLSRASFHRLTVQRDLRPHLQAQMQWTSSAHESMVYGEFNGYRENLRSKTIDGIGIGVRGNSPAWHGLSAFGTAGAEVADWTDTHGLLVSGYQAGYSEVKGEIEGGVTVGGGARWIIRHGVGFEAFLEQVYWPGLDLGERRTGVGFVISR